MYDEKETRDSLQWVEELKRRNEKAQLGIAAAQQAQNGNNASDGAVRSQYAESCASSGQSQDTAVVKAAEIRTAYAAVSQQVEALKQYARTHKLTDDQIRKINERYKELTDKQRSLSASYRQLTRQTEGSETPRTSPAQPQSQQAPGSRQMGTAQSRQTSPAKQAAPSEDHKPKQAAPSEDHKPKQQAPSEAHKPEQAQRQYTKEEIIQELKRREALIAKQRLDAENFYRTHQLNEAQTAQFKAGYISLLSQQKAIRTKLQSLMPDEAQKTDEQQAEAQTPQRPVQAEAQTPQRPMQAEAPTGIARIKGIQEAASEAASNVEAMQAPVKPVVPRKPRIVEAASEPEEEKPGIKSAILKDISENIDSIRKKVTHDDESADEVLDAESIEVLPEVKKDQAVIIGTPADDEDDEHKKNTYSITINFDVTNLKKAAHKIHDSLYEKIMPDERTFEQVSQAMAENKEAERQRVIDEAYKNYETQEALEKEKQERKVTRAIAATPEGYRKLAEEKERLKRLEEVHANDAKVRLEMAAEQEAKAKDDQAGAKADPAAQASGSAEGSESLTEVKTKSLKDAFHSRVLVSRSSINDKIKAFRGDGDEEDEEELEEERKAAEAMPEGLTALSDNGDEGSSSEDMEGSSDPKSGDEDIEEDSGKKAKKERKLPFGKNIGMNIFIVLLCLIIAVGFAKFFTVYVAHQTKIAGESMEPALDDGDSVIIQRVSLYFSDPKRFDVVVFSRGTGKNKTYLIKRIVGLPGETVQITDGQVYIDGEPLKGDKYGKEPILDPGMAEKPVHLEANMYFCLGDNRNMSTDSRSEDVGPVNKRDMDGKAWICTWPLKHFGSLK
ncbi:MAG: signal peptidase I [Lachnospiraceae bacterium]|nr:signal peptidase I [Lachnospiraceae bacterium]MEE3461084.1 signal peptidase I [Lachnospiraceae bacterium]